MDALKKLMEKKLNKEGEMDPAKKKARIDLLEELRNEAEEWMKDDLMGHKEGLKKVTVASDSEEGLKKGLEKAEEVLEAKEDESEEGLEQFGKEMEDDSDEDMSALSREDLLKKLMELKRK